MRFAWFFFGLRKYFLHIVYFLHFSVQKNAFCKQLQAFLCDLFGHFVFQTRIFLHKLDTVHFYLLFFLLFDSENLFKFWGWGRAGAGRGLPGDPLSLPPNRETIFFFNFSFTLFTVSLNYQAHDFAPNVWSQHCSMCCFPPGLGHNFDSKQW